MSLDLCLWLRGLFLGTSAEARAEPALAYYNPQMGNELDALPDALFTGRGSLRETGRAALTMLRRAPISS